MGWGGAFDQVLQKIPVQDRKERWKNKFDNLKKERNKLMKGKWNVKKGKRFDVIDDKLTDLVQLLKNAIR